MTQTPDAEMTVESAAAGFDGYEYPFEISRDTRDTLARSGIVIVYGASDDLMEFDGAIHDEIGATGENVYISPSGILPDFDELCDQRDENAMREYFREKEIAMPIRMIWDRDGISWQYETDIPRQEFRIMEDGEIYCRAIVFRLEDADATKVNASPHLS